MSQTSLDLRELRKWKRYPVTKKLPLAWSMCVPDHWEICRLKEVADARPSNVDKKSAEGEVAVKLCNYTDVYYNDRISPDLDFMDATASASQIEQFSIESGDVLITKDSESWDDIAVPAYVPQKLEGVVCGYHLTLIRPDSKRVHGAFLARCFEAEGLADQFRVLAKGITRYGLGTQDIRCSVVPIPPLPEQRAIAAFLDRETARIDALIRHKERLIALLEEKRQAVISHAVTQGLDPRAKIKQTRTQWFPHLPHHWALVAIKHLVSRPVIDGPHESPPRQDSGVPFVSAESIRNGRVNFDKKWGFISDEDHKRYSRRYKPQRGDIFLVKLGATTGQPAIVETDIDFNIWVPLAAIRLKDTTLRKFIYYVLQSISLKAAFELSWTIGTQQTLGLGTISNLQMPIPPAEERLKIVEYLDGVLPGLDGVTAEITKSNSLLQEYRTALISAAVTGQIDVREEVWR